MEIAQIIALSATPVLGMFALIFGAGKWIGRVDENTKATERLTQAFEKHAEVIVEKVDDHEVRIRLLEETR